MGMKIFNENRKKANLDALAGETYELAIDAQRWMRKPEFFGGGGDTCAETCDWSEASLPAMGYASSANGDYIGAHGVMSLDKSDPLVLLVKGTNFQVKVWQALLSIPPGFLASYQEVAAHVGQPKASRAVGSAVSQNPIAYLIPCHRVITKVGRIHGYRWGATRKQAMLGWEASRRHLLVS